MEKVCFGIIGVGNQGSYYANIFKGIYPDKAVKNGVLTALCDNDEERLSAAKVVKIILAAYRSNGETVRL